MNELDKLLRQFEGADYYEPDDPKLAYPGLILAALAVVAWVAFIGAGYAIWRAALAVWGA